MHALRLEPLLAEHAAAVRVGEWHDDDVAPLNRAHVAADVLDDADRLMAHALPLHVRDTVVGPQIAAADAGAGDADQRVGRVLDRGVRNILDPDFMCLGHDGRAHAYFAPARSRYCSSVTCSIHVTGEPFSDSWMAMWVMAVVSVAPCQ